MGDMTKRLARSRPLQENGEKSGSSALRIHQTPLAARFYQKPRTVFALSAGRRHYVIWAKRAEINRSTAANLVQINFTSAIRSYSKSIADAGINASGK